jgi:hypothetical protein
MWKYIFLQIYILWAVIDNCNSISSPIEPFTNYSNVVELQANVADLYWTVNNDKQEITFELHINTTGWIGLGISPGKKLLKILFDPDLLIEYLAGGMPGADIGTGWVDSSGNVFLQVNEIFSE